MEHHKIKEKINGLKNLKSIYEQDGNWNHDDYHNGVYIGLEISIATLEGRDPDFSKARHNRQETI